MPFMRDSLSLTHSACTPARHVAWWIACAFLVSLHLISPMLSVVAVAEMSTPRVVALGDLHGDLDNTLIILRAAGLIVTDEPIGMVSDVKENAQSARWVGGNTVLIQVGDVMDRGPNTWELLDLFHDLTAQAQAAGGDVIMLYGNHEIMNLAGQFSYVHPQETLGNNILERIQILASGGSRYAEYLRAERKTAHVIHNTLFVHAGVIPIWASLGIDGINQRVRDAVMANDWNHPILDVTGPLWSRSLVNEAVNGACQTLLDVLAVLDLKRMVVGHTPEQSGEIGEYCEGKLYVIDTMLSRWMRSEGTARVVEKYVRALSLRPVFGEEVVNLAASQSQLQDIPPEYLGLDPRGGNTSEDEMDIMDKLIFTPDQPEFVDVELEELGIPSNLVEPGTDESSNVNENSPDTLHDFFKTNNDLLQEVNNLLREFERIKGHVPLKPALDDEPDAPEEL